MSGAPAIACDYFDGLTTARHPVTLRVEDAHARVQGNGIDRRVPLNDVKVSERMGAAPRLVSFADGAFCEVRDHASLDALLAATGYRDPVVARIQSRWLWVGAALAACVGLVVLGYLYLLPWAAEQAAGQIPRSAMDSISQQTLAAMDQHLFKPSKLPADRQEALSKRFALLATPDGDQVPHAIVFRSSPRMGANALALPNGTIIVTDELVDRSDTDAEILSVLTHELGHVQRRHGLRLLLEGSVVGLVVAWYLGDISSLVAAIPAALLQARYSRDLEQEADDYGARMLRFNGLSPSLLAAMLEKLESAHRPGGSGAGYLGSHPATADRIRRLREQR